jgi:hypothetical protein
MHHRKPESLKRTICLAHENASNSRCERLTLRLDLVLNNQGLALVVNLLGELGGDGVVGSGVLYDQTLVTIDTLEDGGLLDSPFANVGPIILRLVVLLRVGRLPP